MVYWLELGYFILLLLSISRCLYFWQLKEYRWDRFYEWLKTGKRQYCLPTRYFFRPRLTLKILVLFYLTVYLSVSLMNNFSRPQLAAIAVYFAVPLTTAAAVALISPISDLFKAMIVLAAKIKLKLLHRQLLVIGVTGSFGKTSTKEVLAHVLTAKFKVAKTRGTDNTLIGVAKTVLFKLPLKTEILVTEMGAYKIGEIAAICRLVRPKIGILTGINEQHLALFGSLANTVKAKSELLLALPKDGLAVVNGQNQLAKKAAAAAKAPVKFYKEENSAAAKVVAGHLGIKRINLSRVFLPRLAVYHGLNQATVIDDSFSSNPSGFARAIDLAKKTKAKKRYLLTNGIIELGPAETKIHQALAKKAFKVFDLILTTRPIVANYFKAGLGSEKELYHQLKNQLTKKDLLLIEGRFSVKFIKALCLNQS